MLAFTAYSGAIFITVGEDEDQALNNTYFIPQYHEVTLNDLSYSKIPEISSGNLGFEHDSLTSLRPTFPIVGIVAPIYAKTVGGVVLKYKVASIQSFFAIDAEALVVYLCDRTLHALGIDDADHATIIVHGQPIGVLRSTGYFS